MIDNIIVIAYLVGIFLIGILSGRGIKNLREYSVVNRSFGYLVVFATLSASFIGGGFSIGNSEKVFLFGIVNIIALWGFSLKEILVAAYIAPRIDHFPNFVSVGDIMEPCYGKLGKVITGVFSVLLNAGIVGAQVGAIGKICEVFLHFPPIWGILIGVGIVITYSTIGGMKAVVYTDIIQFILLFIGIPLVLFFGIRYAGGIEKITESVPPSHFTFLGKEFTIWKFISLFLTFLLGETLVPPYVQRLFIGKNAKHAAKGTLLSGIVSIPFFAITGAIGLVALTIKPDLDPTLAMPFVIKTVLPIGLKGFVIAGIISIVMSSADSFLNAASVSFVNDIVKPLAPGRLSEKKQLLLSRVTTICVGVLSIVFALTFKSIFDILIYAYNFWAPVILVPLAASLLGVKAGIKSFLAGAIGGILTVFIWNGLLNNPGGVDGLVVGVFVNFIAFFVSYRLCKRF
jgi:solute:Na+ symporter, SSS family